MARFSVTLKINGEEVRKTGCSTRNEVVKQLQDLTVELNSKVSEVNNDIETAQIIVRKKNRLGHKKYEKFTADFVKGKFENSRTQ